MNKNTVNFNAELRAVYFDIPSDGCGTFMTTAEISDKLVIKGSIKKPMPLNRLGMVLQQQGFRSKRVGKAGTRGWIVRERDAEEINANRSIEGKCCQPSANPDAIRNNIEPAYDAGLINEEQNTR